MSARTNPLPRSVTLWYGLGAVPGGIATTAGVFLVFFYNQVLGVPGAQVGLVLFAIALFDAVSDPVVGVLSDRTRSRLGRRHPYLIGDAVGLHPGATPESVAPAVASRLGLAQGLSMALLTAAALFFIRGYGIDRVRHERVRAELEARTHSR